MSTIEGFHIGSYFEGCNLVARLIHGAAPSSADLGADLAEETISAATTEAKAQAKEFGVDVSAEHIIVANRALCTQLLGTALELKFRRTVCFFVDPFFALQTTCACLW